jgi:hypothetical protein
MADPPSKESYRLCIDKETENFPRHNKGMWSHNIIEQNRNIAMN